jgi:hypothetical protein
MPGGPQSRFSCFGCRHPVAPTHFGPRRCRRRPIVSAAGQAMPIHGDLATDHGAAAVYTEANKAFGGIDILINNAGAYEAPLDLFIAIEKNGLGFFGLSPRLIREAGDVCPWIIFRDGLLYFAASAPDLAT